MKRAYPTFAALCKTNHLAYIPDMDICAEGNSVENAIEIVAGDAIGLKGIDLEKRHWPQGLNKQPSR